MPTCPPTKNPAMEGMVGCYDGEARGRPGDGHQATWTRDGDISAHTRRIRSWPGGELAGSVECPQQRVRMCEDSW